MKKNALNNKLSAGMITPIVVCVLILSGLATESQARDIGALGGGGGDAFRSACPSGQVTVGFGMDSGSALDAISLLCVRLNAQKTGWEGDDVRLHRSHGGRGGSFQTMYCQRGYAVRHLHVYVDKHKIVNHIRMTCEDLASGNWHDGVPKRIGGQAVGDVRFSCGPHEWANGIYGRSGDLVDQLGLSCEKLAPTSQCNDYATNTVTQAQQGKACGFSGARWDTNRTMHLDWCMGLKGNHALPQSETAARNQALKDCAAKAAGTSKPSEEPKPMGKAATVIANVDVYKASGGTGRPVGMLRVGQTVSLLSGGCQGDNWCNVSGNAVPSGNGWVYNGPDYRSLKF